MAEAKNPVTQAQAQENMNQDFARAAARRAEMIVRRGGDGGVIGEPKLVVEMEITPGVIQPTPMHSVTGKAAQILSHLHEGEPVFIFRAQDILSVMVLQYYANLLDTYLGVGDNPQSISTVDAANDFRTWQQANPGKVKLPD